MHKINGISYRFLYFNDDYILEEPIFLNDFFIESREYTFRPVLYSIPSCSSKCLDLYNNNQCDIESFILECDFDGNDCKNQNSLKPKFENFITYFDSLAYTNNLFNRVYGYKKRKTPAHVPILIDKEIMNNLQDKFKLEFDETKSSRFREGNNIQIQFAYFSYLISEPKVLNVGSLFDEFDEDIDGFIQIPNKHENP